jgi:hypothetical protein
VRNWLAQQSGDVIAFRATLARAQNAAAATPAMLARLASQGRTLLER